MTTASLANQTFVLPYKHTNKDWETVVSEFLTTKKKEMARIFAYAAAWTSLAYKDDEPMRQLYGRVSSFMGDVKNALSASEIPEKAVHLGRQIDHFAHRPTFDKGRKLLFKELAAITAPVCDTIDLFNKFVPINPDKMVGIKGLSLTTTFLSSGNDMIDQVQRISKMKEINPQRTALYLINIARDVSYIALSILALSGLVLGYVIAPWMILACLTSGLLFGIAGFFYEHIVNPEGLHLDLGKINANMKAAMEQLTQG